MRLIDSTPLIVKSDGKTVLVQDILNAPTVDAEPVVHGKWKVVYQNKNASVYECSKCGHLTFGFSDYCICGVKMDQE